MVCTQANEAYIMKMCSPPLHFDNYSFLAKTHILVLGHPSHLPNLDKCNFSIFLQLKIFHSEDIYSTTVILLKGFP